MVILACIDKRDTYQLVEFLLSFKQNQFWIHGLYALASDAGWGNQTVRCLRYAVSLCAA